MSSRYDLQRLSKTVAHALRHQPWRYGLEPDSQGWVPVESLLEALRSKREVWRGLTEADLVEMIDSSDKKRYEISEGRIRAYYGHSLPEKIEKNAAIPPDVLYHGTNAKALEIILKEGLKPMSRQYVHLSVDEETARQVGSRKRDAEMVLLSVQALEAYQQGVVFYKGHEAIWLADYIPPEFIRVS
jgi:putative RNA 2'-phosphotransferase